MVRDVLTLAANVCDASGAVCKLGTARLTSTGSFDTTFDGDGKALIDLSSFGATVGTARLLKINTRTYVAGQYFTAADNAAASSFLFAMTDSGAGDTTFGTNGLRTYNNGASGLEGYGGMSVNGNSAICIAGDRDVAAVPNGVAAMHRP
ncbi:MAG TPA: hypothetical protein VM513_27635 [Kofleriaceae bacterium]|nr:hypothetical protein [Kofleriaceae bacterium]